MTEDKFFIAKVADLFIENGAKTLTMDDIAKEFGMSKKTLYKDYKNKEVLLEEALSYTLQDVLERIRNLDNTIENAIERMLSRDEEIEKASSSNNSILLRQLIKYYPKIFNRHMKDFSEKFSAIMVSNIERGRKQGYYREDFDALFYAQLFFHLVMSYNSTFFDISNLSRSEYHYESLKFYMNAITNDTGKDYMKAFEESLK